MKEESPSQKTKGREMMEEIDLEEGAGAGPGPQRDSDQGHPCQDMMNCIEEMIPLEGT